MAAACGPTEPQNRGDASAAMSSGEAVGTDRSNNAPAPPHTGSGQANTTNAPGAVIVLPDGGVAAASHDDAGVASVRSDAGMASAGLDAAAQTDWSGLVTLGPSRTTGPDGAVINLDGGLRRYDPDAAGPVLNAEAQAACLTLVNNICSRSADCQISLTQLPATRRSQLVASCTDTLLFNHNCNRAIRTTSDFNTCAESVKTSDCVTVFTEDFGSSCISQITLQP
jgi:hypothetical protein